MAPAELAACVSALVFESRQADDAGAPRLPGARCATASAEMVRTWGRLDELEQRPPPGLPARARPRLRLGGLALGDGRRPDTVLREGDLAAGDFVRWTKQLLDLLDQIADAPPRALRAAAARPVEAAPRRRRLLVGRAEPPRAMGCARGATAPRLSQAAARVNDVQQLG